MDETRVVHNSPSWYEVNGETVHCDSFEPDRIYYKKDLWVPIKFHYTLEWLKAHIK